MFRDRITQWTRTLNLRPSTKDALKLFTEKSVKASAYSPVRRIGIDQNRVEFYLNVSRAYFKLAQVAK